MCKETSYTLEQLLVECRRQHGNGVLILTQVLEGNVGYLPIHDDFKVGEGLQQFNIKAWQEVIEALKDHYLVITREGLRTLAMDRLALETGFVLLTVEEPSTFEETIKRLKPTNDLMMLFWLSEVLKCLVAHRERRASSN